MLYTSLSIVAHASDIVNICVHTTYHLDSYIQGLLQVVNSGCYSLLFCSPALLYWWHTLVILSTFHLGRYKQGLLQVLTGAVTMCCITFQPDYFVA